MNEKNRMLKLSGILSESELSFLKNSYYGIEVPAQSIKNYDDKLKVVLGKDYFLYKSNKDERDGDGQYHITVISPMEYPSLKKKGTTSLIGDSIDGKPKFLGLGKAEKGENTSYYIVVEFPEANELRKSIGLKEKDFHVTLGFNKKDVHDIPKDKSTII